jgi:hypothetical protein
MTDRRDEIAGELEKGMAETVSLKERPLRHLPFPTAAPAPAFRSQISLTCKNSPPIVQPLESNVLSNPKYVSIHSTTSFQDRS